MPTKDCLEAAGKVSAGEVCQHLLDTLWDKLNAMIVLILGVAPYWHSFAKEVSEDLPAIAQVVAIILGLVQIYATIDRLRRGRASE